MRAPRRTLTVASLLGLAVGVPCVAVAGGVGTTSRTVSSASTSVSSCGSLSGIGVSWTATANVVTAVTLTSIPAACNGATLSVTFTGTANTSLGSAGPVTVTGTSQTLSSVTGSPASTSVTGAFVSAVGP